MSDSITRKWFLSFPKCECEKPIIYHLVKDFGLIVNIFRARVMPDEEGFLVLDVTGSEENINKALEYIRTFNVILNLTGKGVDRNEDKCTGCGACLSHCPTQALHIENRATMAVEFDEIMCIECLACIPVCPYDACTSVF